MKKKKNLQNTFCIMWKHDTCAHLNANISAVHSSAFFFFLKKNKNNCVFYCCLQFAVHYFADWVCHIHFTRHFSAAIHPFWFDQGRRKNIFLVNSFFHHFLSVSRGALRFFPLCSHFASGGTARLQISGGGGNSDRYYSVSSFTPEAHAWRACTRCS